jgi:hypothetical protein
MKRLFLAMVFVSTLLVSAQTSAHADANPNASCIALGSSHGTTFGIDRDEASQVVKANAVAGGYPPGADYSLFAQLHNGSVSACFPGH